MKRKIRKNQVIIAALAVMIAAAGYLNYSGRIFGGKDDAAQTANELASHLKGWQTHVNLIPLNKVEGRSYNAAVNSNIMQFKKTLENAGIAVTVRRTLGADIDAACGQLRNR